MVHTATLVVVSLVGLLAAVSILLVAQVQMVANVDSTMVRFDRSTGSLIQCGHANVRSARWWAGAGQDCANRPKVLSGRISGPSARTRGLRHGTMA